LFRAFCIIKNLFLIVVRAPVNFHDQLRVDARKVRYVTIYWMLPAKLCAKNLATAQETPQRKLRAARLLAHSTRAIA
jgi:hypothetical protein